MAKTSEPRPNVGECWFIRIKGASTLTRVRTMENTGKVWRIQSAGLFEMPWDGEEGVDFTFVQRMREP